MDVASALNPAASADRASDTASAAKQPATSEAAVGDDGSDRVILIEDKLREFRAATGPLRYYAVMRVPH